MSHGGMYRAEVVDVNDPRSRRRVRLRIPSVFGDTVTGWAEPLFDCLVPREKTRVWATFEAGDLSHPLYLAPRGVSVFPATVAEVSGFDARLSVPPVFGVEVTEWASPIQNAPAPFVGQSVWAVIQESANTGSDPGRQQVLYVNPRDPVPPGGGAGQILEYDEPFKAKWANTDELEGTFTPASHGNEAHSATFATESYVDAATSDMVSYVDAATSDMVESADITHIEQVTQTEYDGLTPDANTLYLIEEE